MNRPKTTAEIMRERDRDRDRSGGNGRKAKTPAKEDTPPEPPPPVETFTAAELLAMEIPEPRWAVEGLLPEGLNLLAGKPKLGKSWAALNIGLAVTTGGVALGKVPVEAGDALYLALEDTKRRLKKRIELLLPGEASCNGERVRLGRLTLARVWPRQDRGGLEAIAEWLDAHPEARLIVIDTWQKFRPPKLRGGNDYEQDYEHAAAVKAVADKYGVAILVLHHCRKGGAEDPLEEVSGTLGLTGAADGILVLRRERGQCDASLHVTGRDIEEEEFALQWDPARALWTILGDADAFRLSKERAEVLKVYSLEARPLGPADVAKLLGRTTKQEKDAVRRLVWKLGETGHLLPLGGGMYSLSGHTGHTSHGGHCGNSGNGSVIGCDRQGEGGGHRDADIGCPFPRGV